ncbi:archaetidylserine decarboxylase [Cocleimonas flava]|uniref:Phosphatidylserine decarboxylase proenzyme n=1 Tax=Cocleimonas flava TaxID=634765 RepID=A0A4R1F1E0_9GAMM|nr:archaetidylserine decarboxylase [Cocleimonas flava]TCJ85348.1 phosphatidylserine decarboxylase [Cocleimonas flava]
MNASLLDYLKSGALYALPHHFISRIVFKLTRVKSPLVPKAITLFSKAFDVNLDEAKNSDPASYSTFNEFFTRELKEGLRPISDTRIVSPVDGTISEFGDIKNGQLLQAKGITYSLEQLLGGNKERANLYDNGQFITIYLSPRDYHRIHMPCTGKLTEQVHIPGRLFSVAKHTVKTVKSIFARNERVVASFDTEYGSMTMVLVGAINVAAIETVWHGLITPPKGETTTAKSYKSKDIQLDKGKEMGRFNMGSTVILVFQNNAPKLSDSLKVDQTLQLGESLSET